MSVSNELKWLSNSFVRIRKSVKCEVKPAGNDGERSATAVCLTVSHLPLNALYALPQHQIFRALNIPLVMVIVHENILFLQCGTLAAICLVSKLLEKQD